MRINEGEVFRKRTARDATEKGVSMEAVKDKGELLIESVEDGLAQFKGKFIREFGRKNKAEIEGFIKNIREFKKESGDKYKELLDKTFQFSGVADFRGKYYISDLEKATDKKIASQIGKISVFNELIEIEKLNLPQRLEEIADKSLKEGKFPRRYALENLLKTDMSEKVYRIIERGLKIGDWKGVSNALDNSNLYELLLSDDKFGQLEDSIKELQKNYGPEIETEPLYSYNQDNLNALLDKKGIENILQIKNEVERLVAYYKADKITKLSELRLLADIKKDFGFEKFLEGKPKRIVDKIKERLGSKSPEQSPYASKRNLDKVKQMYDLKGFKSVEHLIKWFRIDKENLGLILSPEFAKKLEKVSNKIGQDKAEIIHFLINHDVYLKSPVFEELAKDDIVFSRDAKTAIREEKLSFHDLFGEITSINERIYGRKRYSSLLGFTNYITLGRPESDPYKGGIYVAAMRDLKKKDIERYKSKYFSDKYESELKEATEKMEYVKECLPSELKNRLEKISETMKQWEKEEEKIKWGKIHDWTAGAYVRFDSNLGAGKSLDKKLNIPAEKYRGLYLNLDKGFKAVSQESRWLGGGIEELYELMQKKESDLKWLDLHKNEISEQEKKIIGDRYKDNEYLLGAIESMERVYDVQKGIYLTNPPLHGGAGGVVPADWTTRSYALRDNIFYKKTEKDGEENYINVKEYHLGRQDNDLKVRLYSFSEKPDQKELGKDGMTVEIERNGKTKFLNETETKIFMRELKKRTLATLYIEDSMLLKVEK